jgi:hypothetical protein
MIEKIRTKTFLLLMILVLGSNYSLPQTKGDVVLSISVGFFSKGGLSLKIFPVDAYAIELHGGIFPGFYNYGFALHHHLDKKRPNTFIQIGVSNFGGFLAESSDTISMVNDSIAINQTSVWGINGGLGREFSSGEVYFLAGGITYILNKYAYYTNINTKKSFDREEELDTRLILFFEVGQSNYAKKEEKNK